MGLLVGLIVAGKIKSKRFVLPPIGTMLGALANHVLHDYDGKKFQPMNANFGLLTPLNQKHRKKERKKLYAARALSEIEKIVQIIQEDDQKHFGLVIDHE